MGEMGEMGSVYEQYYTGERVHICAYESARERALMNQLSAILALRSLSFNDKKSTLRELDEILIFD